MKEAQQYQKKDGSYDCDQVILDAFDGDMRQFEAFIGKRIDNRTWGIPDPTLPEPYEALYQQVYRLELEWVEKHKAQLRREQRKRYGFDPIVTEE